MIRAQLMALAEPAYRAFMSRLLPTVKEDTILGVRVPHIRALAARVTEAEADAFLCELPHRYYEENMLHACLICRLHDIDRTFSELSRFLPFVDNWGVCDSLRPRILTRHKARLYAQISVWLASSHAYTVRFGIEMLMLHFLCDEWAHDAMEQVARVTHPEYYVHMMVAWFFATALAVCYSEAVPYIEERRLAPLTHNKAIDKAIDSHRINEQTKRYLRSLRMTAK